MSSSGGSSPAPSSSSARRAVIVDDEDGDEDVYCICKSTDVNRFMIGCEHCEDWFHGDCINVTEKEAKYIKRYYCPECVRKNPSIKIVYKSSYVDRIREKEREKKRHKESRDRERSRYLEKHSQHKDRHRDRDRDRDGGHKDKHRERERERERERRKEREREERRKEKEREWEKRKERERQEERRRRKEKQEKRDRERQEKAVREMTVKQKQVEGEDEMDRLQTAAAKKEERTASIDSNTKGSVAKKRPISDSDSPKSASSSEDAKSGPPSPTRPPPTPAPSSQPQPLPTASSSSSVSTTRQQQPPAKKKKKKVLRESNYNSEDDYDPRMDREEDEDDEEEEEDAWIPPTPVQRPKERGSQLKKRGKASSSQQQSSKKRRNRRLAYDTPSSGDDDEGGMPPGAHNPEVDRAMQCFGPNCVRQARTGVSKYCSDQCGINLASMRIYQTLPDRIREWNLTPCAAEKRDRKELEVVRGKQAGVEQRLNQLNVEFRMLEDIIAKGKTLTLAEEHDSDNEDEEAAEQMTVHCVTCGANVQTNTAIRHMSKCYNKIESQTSFASRYKTQIDDRRLFCDYFNPKEESYCKRLKVLCPEHNQEPKVGDDEVCGYPLQKELFAKPSSFCLKAKKTCHMHFQWEKLRRAELDMERVKQWMKVDELLEQERQLKAAMSSRAGVLGLMLHSTFNHELDGRWQLQAQRAAQQRKLQQQKHNQKPVK